MKKIFILLGIMVLFVSGCSSNVDDLQKDVDILKQQVKQLQEEHNSTNPIKNEADIEADTTNVLNTQNTSTDNFSANSNELQELSIGEKVNVKTQYGEFDIQIDKVRYMEDYDEEDDSCPVAIECIVKNINFSALDYYVKDCINGVILAEENNILQLTDHNQVSYPYYNLDTNEGSYSFAHDLQIGSTGREAYSFLVSANQKEVSVILNNQYILNTTIQ